MINKLIRSKYLMCYNGARKWEVGNKLMKKVTCSCCGHTYDIDDLMTSGLFNVCPICYWEEDPNVTDKEYSSVNKSSLIDYKNAYVAHQLGQNI